ncbi:transmembrane protease serine 6 [Osmerus eperlanus]|uniref:transmembrane protease serine 6 n=1 Tax=Osmerus eperlanus TaxID=29151 RepID=UPI002E0E13DA
MAVGHGSKKSRTCDMDDALAAEQGTPGSGAKVVSSKNLRPCKCLVALLLFIAIIVGGASLLWYFLDYRVWVLEPRVQQQYVARLTILNRNFSSGLSSHTSSAFRTQAVDVQDMVKMTVKASDLSRYFNSSTVFAFGEGSVVAHFWLLLSVPGSHVGKVNLERVNSSLLGRLEQTASYWGYKLHLPSFSITETEPKVVELLKASFDCYRYQLLIPGAPVPLRGPDTQLSSCLWHLQAGPGPGFDTSPSPSPSPGVGTGNGPGPGPGPGPGSRLELHMEWLLPECRDRLAVYNTLTPSDANLITSVYGCSSHERVVQVVSSGSWMTVIWKQGLYNYKNTFSLAAQAWPSPVCSSRVRLQPVLGVQGFLRTPFYPSYYPPDTTCTWTLTVPSTDYGVSLEFEGYELSRANYNQVCTQGQWLVQNRRLCGTRGLQPYKERLYLLSTTTTVVMTSEVSLTGPGIQVHYSLFNQSDPCPGQFLCSLNGLCVPACDGIKDCPNGLDERNCGRF